MGMHFDLGPVAGGNAASTATYDLRVPSAFVSLARVSLSYLEKVSRGSEGFLVYRQLAGFVFFTDLKET